ncbi:MAG: hypothetical protein ACI82N_000267 [Maricaulis sp.]|jgi:hypothetical protein
MPVKTCDIRVLPAERLAVLDAFGAATIPCLIEAFTKLGQLAEWNPDFDVLILVGRGAGLETFTLPALQTLQAFMLEWNAANRSGTRPRTAIVCADALKRVIADLWAAMNESNHWPVEIGVFASRDQASRWLARVPADLDA